MKNLFLLVLFFATMVTNAQNGFKKGYFINNSGVRLDCYIKNSDWTNNPAAFEYKANSEDSETKTENINNVQEFGIDMQNRFKRFTVKMERSEVIRAKLTQNNNPDWKEETHFLKVLISGEASLYVYNDEKVTKYFYETKTTPLEQLVYIKYFDVSDNNKIKENNQFTEQLRNNLKCADVTEKDYNNLRYDQHSLLNIFSKYNGCFPSATVNFVDTYQKKTFSMRLIPGIYVAKFAVDNPDFDITNVIFKLGIEAEYMLPCNKNNWSVFVSPTYQNFSSGKYFGVPDSSNPSGESQFYATADYGSIELPIGIRHYFSLKGHSKLFLNAAYVFDIPVGNSDLAFESEPFESEASESLKLKSKGNVAVGVGYTYKNFNLELRFNFNRKITGEHNSVDAKYNSSGINLGYSFL